MVCYDAMWCGDNAVRDMVVNNGVECPGLGLADMPVHINEVIRLGYTAPTF